MVQRTLTMSSWDSTHLDQEVDKTGTSIMAFFPFEVEVEFFDKTQTVGRTFRRVLDEFNLAFAPRGFSIVCDEPEETCMLYMAKRSGKAKTDYPSKF